MNLPIDGWLEFLATIAVGFFLAGSARLLRRRSASLLFAALALFCAASLWAGATLRPQGRWDVIPIYSGGPDNFQGIFVWQVIAAAMLAATIALSPLGCRPLLGLSVATFLCVAVLMVRVGALES